MKRIGLLTSGGDCQALNATMRGVVKGLFNNLEDLEVYGFDDGYKGLIYGNYRMLSAKDFSGILTRGGTILGTSRQPFKLMRVPDANGLDKVEAMKQTYELLLHLAPAIRTDTLACAHNASLELGKDFFSSHTTGQQLLQHILGFAFLGFLCCLCFNSSLLCFSLRQIFSRSL